MRLLAHIGPWMLAILFSTLAMAEQSGFRFTENKRSHRVQIQVIHNLVIVPVQINDSPPLYFILDSGVRTTLITEPLMAAALGLEADEAVFVMGLGSDGLVQALRSDQNTLSIGPVKGENMSLLVLPENILSFSEMFGFPVYGIIGYDFLKEFPIYINYAYEYMRIFREPTYRIGRRSHVIPFDLIHQKPYAEVRIEGQNGETLHTRLLIDLGASRPLFLNRGYKRLSNNTMPSFLGRGISGNLDGYKGRLNSLVIGDIELENLVASYPNQDFLVGANETTPWEGILGGGILKRFHVIIDYPSRQMVLRKNHRFPRSFHTNLSGMEVIALGHQYNEFLVQYVRPGSAAYESGMRAGDRILSINMKTGALRELKDIEDELSGEVGQYIHLTLERDGKVIRKRFRLREDLL